MYFALYSWHQQFPWPWPCIQILFPPRRIALYPGTVHEGILIMERSTLLYLLGDPSDFEVKKIFGLLRNMNSSGLPSSS